MKEEVCSNDSYKSETWFKDLKKDKKELVEMLKEIQKR